MPRKYTKITPQIVEKAKQYLVDPRNFSKVEVARLVGISDHSLTRIVQGYYDQPVEKQNTETQQIDSSPSPHGKTVTEIPFDELEAMMRCRAFVEEMFSIALLSDKADDELYFPRHLLFTMCNRYFPEDVKRILDNLNTYA